MSASKPVPMRERTRRLVQAELTVIAQDLFVEQGYEATTVDQIAAAAGMSKRTFFRYFASKDDLVIGKYDLFGDRMVEALTSRPEDEPVWESLRRVFDMTAVYVVEGPERARNEAMELIVQSTPALNAGYLEKLSRMQDLLVDEVTRRLARRRPEPSRGERPTTTGPPSPAPRAIVGAAFACLTAAQTTYRTSDQARPFEELLDDAMGALDISDRRELSGRGATHSD